MIGAIDDCQGVSIRFVAKGLRQREAIGSDTTKVVSIRFVAKGLRQLVVES